MNNPDAILAD